MTYRKIAILDSERAITETVDSILGALVSLDQYSIDELLTFEGSIDGRSDYNDITQEICENWISRNGFYGTENVSLELLNENEGPIPMTIVNYMENNGWHNYDDGSDAYHEQSLGN